MKATICIRPMLLPDIPVVVAIHRRVLPTVTSRMGPLFLEFFYRTLLNQPLLHHALVALHGKEVIGAISATGDARHTQRLLTPLLSNPKAMLQLLTALFQRRVTLAELYERIVTERDILKRYPHRYQTILTLLVKAKWQRKGIGAKLLAALEEPLPVGTRLYVDTEASNSVAQSFYKLQGFRRQAAIRSSVVFSKKIALKQTASSHLSARQ